VQARERRKPLDPACRAPDFVTFAVSAWATARPIPELAPVRKIRFIDSTPAAPEMEPPSEAEQEKEDNRRGDLARDAAKERAANNRGRSAMMEATIGGATLLQAFASRKPIAKCDAVVFREEGKAAGCRGRRRLPLTI